jgi:DNA ligase (NAD+)
MIIPQIAENLTRSGTYNLPKHCPCCGTELTVKVSPSGVRDLFCPNEECIARHAKKIARYCDKNAMNIDGLSASVIENMMAYGWVQSFKDLYHLDLYRDEIISRPGFGADRYHSIMEEIERSRHCHMYQFLIGIGIPNLGNEAAKTLHQYYYGSFEKFEKAVAEDFRFSRIEGISDVVDRSIHAWFADKKNIRMINALKTEVEFIDKTDIIKEKDNPFLDTTVVVTGTFESFSREGIVSLLTALGAKVEDHVTENTDYLIYGAVPGGKKISFAIKYGVNMLSEKGFGEILGTDK